MPKSSRELAFLSGRDAGLLIAERLVELAAPWNRREAGELVRRAREEAGKERDTRPCRTVLNHTGRRL